MRLWWADNGEAITTLTGYRGRVWSCAFSPDGRRLASAGRDGAVRLWWADGGEAITTLTGHQGWVLSCAFSPDGRRLASAGQDGTVRVWDVASGQEVGFRTVLLSNDAWVVQDPVTGALLSSQGEAWRWLGWLAPDPATGHLIRYPAESFGPLPTQPGATATLTL